jgi:flagellar biosynthesis/type III secretory pathway protein FliH
MKKTFLKIVFGIIGLSFVLTLFSCYTKDELIRRYDQGYSDGNKAGYSKGYKEGTDKGHKDGYNEGNEAGRKLGYNNGYNTAKNEYQKQVNELQNRIASMEINHRTELTASYNRGFQAGEASMEAKILAQVDLNTQQLIRRNRRNEPLFRVK